MQGDRVRHHLAVALRHTPGVQLSAGPEAFLLSSGAAVDVFGLRAGDLPDQVRRETVRQYPRLRFKREFATLWRTEARQVPRGRAAYLRRYAATDLTIRLAPFRDDTSADPLPDVARRVLERS